MSIQEMIQSKACTLVDVRAPFEFEDQHAAGAINIPLDEMLSDEYVEADEFLPSSFLSWSMSWASSPSRHSFWRKAYERLEDIESRNNTP